jgi:alternate signal-mediated exported protein
MKKSVLLTLGSLVMVALLSIGGTMAWFTNSDQISNVFETGSIGVEIKENQSDGDQWVTEGLDFENFLPGDDVTKRAKFENTGLSDGYLRVKVTPAWLKTVDGIETVDQSLDATKAVINYINTTDWKQIGDYYYYLHLLNDGQETSELFNQVSFEKAAGITGDALFTEANTDNKYQGAKLKITIDAQMVQESAALDAFGQAFVDAITPITP